MTGDEGQRSLDVAREQCPFCGSSDVEWYTVRAYKDPVPFAWYLLLWGWLAWLMRRWDMEKVPRWRCRACGRDWSVD